MLIATRKCKKIWDDENLQQETLGAHQRKEAAGLGCPLGLLQGHPGTAGALRGGQNFESEQNTGWASGSPS